MRLLVLLGLSACLLACGQKGPLYLPVADVPPPPADTCATCPPVTVPAAPANPVPETTEVDISVTVPTQEQQEDKRTTESDANPTATPQEPTP